MRFVKARANRASVKMFSYNYERDTKFIISRWPRKELYYGNRPGFSEGYDRYKRNRYSLVTPV